MLVGIHVNAGNDRNGNPRRGWMVWEVSDRPGPRLTRGLLNRDVEWVSFIDEGYAGDRALTDWEERPEHGFPPPRVAILATRLPITPAYYRHLIRGE